MSRWARFRRFFGPDPAGDVDVELSFHLEMRIRELVDEGETPARAREIALRRFGDYDSSRNQCLEINERRRRRMTRTEYVTELRQDVGYALRMLRRTPGFTLVAVVTLALGIGANSAIFSVVHGVLLASLPYRDAGRLFQPRMLYPDGTVYWALSAPDFVSVREHSRVFEQVEAYTTGTFTLLGAGEPQEIRGARVSAGLFELVGWRVALGRGFVPEEHRPGQGTFAVIDHGFWQRAFGGDRGVLGRKVLVGGNPYTIVGVLAAGERLPDVVDMYAPLEYDETFSATTATRRRAEYLEVLGRTRPGVTAVQVDDDLKRIGAQLQRDFPDTNDGLTFTSASLRARIIGDVQRPLLVLLGAVGLVLLIACANVANLLMARASVREGELAVRVAMGAGRGRLLRQLLTEAVVLGLAGGALGLLIAHWSTRALVAAQPADIPRLEEVGVNGPVALFTLAVALVTGLVFGLLPALQATGGRLQRALREGGRGAGPGRTAHRVRAGLVVAEMALSVVLLTGAGLLIRSFVELTRVNPGFKAEQAMAFRIALQGDEYAKGQQIRDRVNQFEMRLRALPGVTSVAATTVLPLSGQGGLIDFQVVGAPPPPANVNREIGIASITPEYFTAIGTPLRRGRGFTTHDHDKAPAVAIVNEAAVRRWFKDSDPLGQQVEMSGVRREVIGVVADVRQRHPGQPVAPQLYTPYAQRTARTVRIVVRSAGDPIALAPAIRAEIRALDPNLAITDFSPLEQLVTRSVARPRFYTALLALFAGVALALAATGIFGVMSYAVAQRAREISIRMALGARTGQVLRMVVGRAVALAAGGALLGIAGAMALGRVIQNQLFGVGVADPLTIGAVVLVLLGSAALASFMPARRAAALDPASALRES
ncbi:MAG TPA: ABC transporter permease [Vicinamibacterales bacterium]|nr:ABC transporter permease [Vicinamibacterales bacterium]